MHPLTFGVEEEFLLVNRTNLLPVPRGQELLDAMPDRFSAVKSHEFIQTQAEFTSRICVEKYDLYHQLLDNRRTASDIAADLNMKLLAVGVSPTDSGIGPVTISDRYRIMTSAYGALARYPVVNGTHIHVGISDRDMAAKVCGRLRYWLPVLQLISSNSPILNGMDTLYSSWRTVLSTRWPSMGITPSMNGIDDYNAQVQFMIDSGGVLDPGMIYWWARPSRKFSTVEIRVCDVGLTPLDSTLLAVLCRALVASLVQDIEEGRPYFDPTDHELRIAHWRAARDGLGGYMLDLERTRLVRPIYLINQLWNKISPILEGSDDLDFVVEQLTHLYKNGTGADKQRQIFHQGGVNPLVDFIAEQTRGEEL